MTSITRARRSTSAISDSDTELLPIRNALTELRVILLSAPQDTIDQEHTSSLLEQIQLLQNTIRSTDKPNKIQDAFRTLHGFRVVLDLLRYGPRSAHELPHDSVSLLSSTLALLEIALHGHWGNRRFFARRVDNGGWNAVDGELHTLLAVLGSDAALKVYGSLLALAVEDETLSDLLENLKAVEDTQDSADQLVKIVGSTLPPRTTIHNPQAVSTLLSLWSQHGRSQLRSLPLVLRAIYTVSTHNLVVVHEAGLLTQILQLLNTNSLSSQHEDELQAGAAELLQLGISELHDAQLIYGSASTTRRLAKTLEQALQKSDGIPFIHFDMSKHGYSCIELPDLGKTFPPPNTSHGYSISIWFQIVTFDPESHTTLFGAFDESQSCFVLVYLEKDTKNLILQTSVTASRPSVRFKSYDFNQGKWYHMCIVHRRQTTTSSSRASLFVDGEFIEQVKSHFPSPPPVIKPNDFFATTKTNVVQAFLGTPKDLAPQELSSSKWRLASACLFGEALDDDLIAVYHELSPRYYGNFQDTLGSFQTYEASAILNLRNETLHPGKEEKSTIVAAIRSKAGNLLSESRILLNISPAAVIQDEDDNSNHLIKSLSKESLKNLRHWTRNGRTSIAINGAVPNIDKALLSLSGVAFLSGEPTVINTQALDDAAWRLGGCLPIGLSLIDSAHTAEDLLRAVNIFFAMIKGSWRNSEAMESRNGFGLLASILAVKVPKLAEIEAARLSEMDEGEESQSLLRDILLIILTFVGYQPDTPENSVIINPLAYRVLLVDLDVWRSAPSHVQRLYYDQFTVFSTGSKHHLFNSGRLSRMRITRKWLIALKGESFTPETLEYFLTAFRSMLSKALNTEAHRSISQYITYALHKAKDRTSQLHPGRSTTQPPPMFGPVTRRSTAPVDQESVSAASGITSDRLLARGEVGVKVLEMYTELLCQRDTTNIKRFSKTITNRWLLHLITEHDPRVILMSMKLLARVLITNEDAYVDKFANKTGGFTIMQYRLKKWWHMPELYTICFAILFNKDIVSINIKKSIDLYTMLSNFPLDSVKVVNPGIMVALVSLLQNGLKSVIQSQTEPTSPTPAVVNGNHGRTQSNGDKVISRNRALSLQPSSAAEANNDTPSTPENIKIVQAMTRYLAELQSHSSSFKNYASTSPYIQELLFLLFPLVVSTDMVSAETELNSRDSALTFDGHDVVIRPLSQTSQRGAPIVRTTSVEGAPSPESTKAKPLKRGSSYVLITSEETHYLPSPARLETIASPRKGRAVRLNVTHSLVQEVLELVVGVFTDSILYHKDFAGLKMFQRVPPGFQEHQAYFQSFIIRNTISSLESQIRLDQSLLVETRVLKNLQKFATHLDEAVFEGWFIEGAEAVIDFLGGILEHLQRSDIRQIKTVQLCIGIVHGLRNVMSRCILLKLSENDDSPTEGKTVKTLQKLSYWQMVLLESESSQAGFYKLLSYLLYTKLISKQSTVREVAADVWRSLLVQRDHAAYVVLDRVMGGSESTVAKGFEKILEVDNASFIAWIDEHRVELDSIFLGRLSGEWESFTAGENRYTENNYKNRISKRREKLKVWVSESLAKDDILRRHEINAGHWKTNIHSSELLKRQRASQDQQDGLAFSLATWKSMENELYRPFGLCYSGEKFKNKLDMTEGRTRMRLRLLPDRELRVEDYKPKRAASKTKKPLHIPSRSHGRESSIVVSPTLSNFQAFDKLAIDGAQDKDPSDPDLEDEYEIVDEPNRDEYEDKNRKVMRSLQRGDSVEFVHNVSRLLGLEPCEGLLIVGKHNFYLIDQYFQRADGEIVDVWQAPADERDNYVQIIAGQPGQSVTPKSVGNTHETRSWRWEEVLSISKRRFLFRDVGIEVFFVDGESYLLTVATPKLRDEIYQRLMSKAQSLASGLSSTNPEELWRVESLRSTEDNPQSFGAKFTSVFTQGTANPATKKWLKGEISNFQYLMLVNTMAGRTFNDLTQYPVFPWVLADYDSEELDLTNPRSFRDLSKPMGAQTPERQDEFNEKYKMIKEMSDGDTPAFHYATHYCSSSTVAGYLIRLQPFVQSHLLLQNGSFDHPDRLFYSVEKAWKSASKENMTDVRELIPEFYYLPEMFTNPNGYDFGLRQGGEPIDNVTLPRWAKGDPHIFVAKHREALESDHVSRHLHRWIDLIFGHKQRGEAALEATNVFHYLSYRGSKDLDTITDVKDLERTVSWIHNFGQTPHQVFHRAHPAKEGFYTSAKRLDNSAETLTRLPFPAVEIKDRITTLIYSSRHEKVLASGPTRLFVPPQNDKFMEWGFTDGSLRFYQNEGHKLIGLVEHVHQSQVSAVIFADSKTLVTAGADCTISVWAVSNTAKSTELFAKGSLFGHRTAVTHLAVSKSFSTLVSASQDGAVLLWDLNRLTFIRVIGPLPTTSLRLEAPITKAPTRRPQQPSTAIKCLAISQTNGNIFISHHQTTSVYTINGHPLVQSQQTCPEQDESITCLSLFPPATSTGSSHTHFGGTDYLSRELLFTGHHNGVVNIWNIAILREGKWILEHVRRLDHLERNGGNITASVTAILPVEQGVWTGDEDGRVWEWSVVNRG